MTFVPAVHREHKHVGTVIEIADDDAAFLAGLPPHRRELHRTPSALAGRGPQEPATAEPAQAATPAAADAGAAASAQSVAVEIKDFAFNPPEITVPVGGSVTWTNDDGTPHTATGLDRKVLQSGPIAPGESFTQTFDTAGTFDYFCEFHANMKGSIVVQ